MLPLLGSGVELRTVERFVLEKPFGRDTASCADMIGRAKPPPDSPAAPRRPRITHACWLLRRQLKMLKEEEIYRIDHYLGKARSPRHILSREVRPCRPARCRRSS